MTHTLKRIAQLRHIEEASARRLLVEAQQAEERCVNEALELAERVESLRVEGDCDADDLQRRHALQLRLELARRRTVRHRQTLAERTTRHQMTFTATTVERRKAERVVEVVEERLAEEAAKAEQAEMDALGTRSWFRRRAA
jgi:hypothetical protein